MLIRLNIDTVRLYEKPAVFDGRLRNRVCNKNSIREVTPEQLIDAVLKGRTFTPAAMTGTTGDTWKSQQVICADIDNDTGKKDPDGHKLMLEKPLTHERALEVMEQHGIKPYFMYSSFSNTADWPKYRIVLILDKPVTDPKVASDLIGRFTGIFNAAVERCADTTASDNARMYYGGRPDSLIYASKQTTPIHLLQALPLSAENGAQDAEEAAAAAWDEWEKSTATHHNDAHRAYSDLQAQFEADKASFDLAGYVAATSGSRSVKRGRALFFNPCPICGHKDDFQVTGNVYHCHSASGGTGGSIIDYLMNRDGLSMGDACDKFKYDIMGYDREEWRRAYIADKYPKSAADNFRKAPQKAATPAGDNVTAAGDKTPQGAAQDATESKQGQPIEWGGPVSEEGDRAADPDQEPAAAQGDTLPGLLTYTDAVNVFETADNEYIELKSFPEFSKTAKVKRHDSIVIAADTGGGKSSLAINFLNELNEKYPCIYINLEMDTIEILRRLVAIQSGIELDRIGGYQNDERTAGAVNAALKIITDRQPLQIVQDAYRLEEIKDLIKKSAKDREEPTIVFIDHTLLVNTNEKTSGRYERFTKISEELRQMALKYNIILFVLLQQSREGKKNEEERPQNGSLKESGSWENDATHILFLWYDPADKQKKILMTKNRHGVIGDFPVNYYQTTQTYIEKQGIQQPVANVAPAKSKQSKREKQKQKLIDAYERAYLETCGHPTIRAMAEAADVTTATIKSWIKEHGGCTVNGVQQDPAGIDAEVEYNGFIKLTPGDEAARVTLDGPDLKKLLESGSAVSGRKR